MKKKSTLILVLSNVILALALVFVLFAQSSPAKIGYVQSAQLLNEYKGMEEARKNYQQKEMLWKANIDSLTSEWQTEVKTFQNEKAEMTQKEKELTEQVIQQKRQQLMDYQKAIQQQAEQANQEMTQKVLDEINVQIADYAKSNGFEVILTANEMGNIAYATDQLDVTKEILKALNGQ